MCQTHFSSNTLPHITADNHIESGDNRTKVSDTGKSPETTSQLFTKRSLGIDLVVNCHNFDMIAENTTD